MPLLEIINSKKVGKRKDQVVINFGKEGSFTLLQIGFPGINEENIDVKPEGIYLTIDGKRLFISFCEIEPICS